MLNGADRHQRPLGTIVSVLFFVYHAAVAYLCTYLPSDPLYVAVSVTGYAWYGCVLSLLGTAGFVKVCQTISYLSAIIRALQLSPFNIYHKLCCSLTRRRHHLKD